MSLQTVNKKVLYFSEIPDNLTENHWISEIPSDVYVPFSVVIDTYSHLEKWILEKYPELEKEDFLIYTDY